MIFKIEKRRSRRGGKLQETRSYYLRYRIGDMPVDKWKSLGVTDFQVADKRAHEFIKECEREVDGILEPKAARDSAKKALTAHLKDYMADLASRGRDGRGGRGGVAGITNRMPAGRMQVGVTGQYHGRFIHHLAQPARVRAADIEPLPARHDLLPELDGAWRQNQNKPTQECFQGG